MNTSFHTTDINADADLADLDLRARELPHGELNLQALPTEYSYAKAASASSVGTFSSAGSCLSSLGSASTLSS